MSQLFRVLVVVTLLSGCKRELDPELFGGPSNPLEFDETELIRLKSEDYAKATGFEDVVRKEFYVLNRTDNVKQYPCSSCHDGPLAESSANADVDNRRMHVDIHLRHAGNIQMTCRTCHNYSDLHSLVRLDNEPVDFDSSYRLCIQCHFAQGRDWAGGAHGKRLAGWRGKRVIMNCTDCHNPHAPAFEKRWPVQYPRIPRSGG